MPASDIYLYIKGQWVRFEDSELLLVESCIHYCKVHTVRGTYMQEISLSLMLDKLDPESFVQVHRFYIIRFKRIVSFDKKLVTLEDRQVPIGKKYYEHFISRVNLCRNTGS